LMLLSAFFMSALGKDWKTCVSRFPTFHSRCCYEEQMQLAIQITLTMLFSSKFADYHTLWYKSVTTMALFLALNLEVKC